ncbi:transposase family protein [Arthrobacter mobilis]|uniref:transposase family protein n=1 Tax=Arthrobacter mobilis TaxID=2724944 RepID=UPI001FE993F5|nr:transposase family protein [Arthrobacter mobilis]
MIFNLPDFRVINTEFLAGELRRIIVESTFPPGCPGCGVISSRRKAGRLQRIRDIPVAGAVELVWAKRRWFCDEVLCGRKSFSEAAPQVPRFARSTARLKQDLVSAVIDSGRAVSETASAYGGVLVAGPAGLGLCRRPAAGCGPAASPDARDR